MATAVKEKKDKSTLLRGNLYLFQHTGKYSYVIAELFFTDETPMR